LYLSAVTSQRLASLVQNVEFQHVRALFDLDYLLEAFDLLQQLGVHGDDSVLVEILLQHIYLQLQFLSQPRSTLEAIRVSLHCSSNTSSRSPRTSSLPFVFLNEEDEERNVYPVCGLFVIPVLFAFKLYPVDIILGLAPLQFPVLGLPYEIVE
jgi:hypothetical protein